MTEEHVEQLRRRILAAPDAATVAKSAQERLFWNSKAHGPEIAAYRQRVALLENNNAQLVAVGLARVNFAVAADPRDLDYRALIAQIALLDRLIGEQAEALDRRQALADTAAREQVIARETPTERALRLLSERLEAAEGRIADLEAALGAREREKEKSAPVRPKPVLSHMPTTIGNGLCPEVSVPPSGARPDPSAARRIVSR
jgi:hypothetical protein